MTGTEATIDGTGWVIVAMAAVVLIGAAVYLLAVWADIEVWEHPDPVDQPRGFRVLGPVTTPPFDWSEYPEFTATAWGEMDAEERWYALNDGWVQ